MAIDRTPLTRKDVVLTAADRDGGAHVDSRLTPEYERLAADGALGSLVRSDSVEIPITNGHLMALRQIGYEVLHSPDLIALAQAPPAAPATT